MSYTDRKIFVPAVNRNNTKHLFYSRNVYKKNALFQVNFDKRNRIIDRHNERDLYGKINTKGKPVILLESGLLPLLTQDEATFCVNFAKDMFKDMVDQYNYLTSRRIMFPSFGGSLLNLEAKRAHQNPERLFQEHLTNMKNFFIDEHLNKTSRKIIDFKDVVEEFRAFCKINADKFPMTLSTFMMSDHCPSRVSGLEIDLTADDKGDDLLKLEVINNRNFNNFINLAARYGFYIDKNSPTTLVVDLGSTKTRIYMNAYGLNNAKDYFDEYCFPAYTFDIKNLQDFLHDCYYTFFKMRPHYKERRICESTGKLLIDQKYRYVKDKAGLDRDCGDAYWDELYFFVRACELKMEVNPNLKRDVLNRVRTIRNIMPRSTLNKQYNDYIMNSENLEISENQERYDTGLQSYIKYKNKATAIIDDFFLDRSPRLRKLLEAVKPKVKKESGPDLMESIQQLGDQYVTSGGSNEGTY
mgnify:CR=1 FL=1